MPKLARGKNRRPQLATSHPHRIKRGGRTFTPVDDPAEERRDIQSVAELTLTAKLNAFRANGAIEGGLCPGSQRETQSQLYR